MVKKTPSRQATRRPEKGNGERSAKSGAAAARRKPSNTRPAAPRPAAPRPAATRPAPGPEPRLREEDPNLIWGIHPVLETLRQQPGLVSEVLVLKERTGPKHQEIIELARQQGARVVFQAKFVSGLPQSAPHQGVAARLSVQPVISLDELLERLSAQNLPPVLLALDSIQDPHNLGAIIRSALAAGVAGVILPRERIAPLSGTAFKASAGAISHLPICRVTNLADALVRLKQAGFWIYGTAKDAALSIYQADMAPPLCLVIGGEGKGMRPRVMEQCDFLVTIPMQGKLDSLNGSVAAAVVLFEIARRRLPLAVG